MSKRRLSNQQRTRVRHRQTKYTDIDDRSTRSGRVLCFYGKEAEVQCAQSNAVVRCKVRPTIDSIAAGDFVSWLPDEASKASEAGVVVAVKARSSHLLRPDGYGKLKVVAANIDQVVLTLATKPEPHQNLIDRYLVVAHKHELDVLIVLNKSDLLAEQADEQSMLDLLHSYEQLDYPILVISAKTGDHLAELQQKLANGTSVFTGQSGVGKSSLIQALLPDEKIKTGKLSEASDKGRHTTTLARLYHFPDGGECIDSPGIREFGLWHMDKADVIAGFRELAPLMGQCRFRNCNHDKEPGCAIREALSSGILSDARAQSFEYILGSLDEVTIRK